MMGEMFEIVPRSRHAVAGAPNYRAKDNAGHLGRDDNVRKFKTRH